VLCVLATVWGRSTPKPQLATRKPTVGDHVGIPRVVLLLQFLRTLNEYLIGALSSDR
jgi:hypothetical protein